MTTDDDLYRNLLFVSRRQLLAEIAALREVHEDLERQQRLATPLSRRTQSPAAATTPTAQQDVQELREKLRQTEEQLAMAQK